MIRILAIARLTFKAAVRYRLVLVLGVLLLATVIALPLLIRHDGTARGFTQILMTYTLAVITSVLGFTSLWLACGTLAREVEECQLQMVVVKPIGRWQIWIGKWLGIMGLNILLLALSGGAVYGLLTWRARHLDTEQQAVLRNEVLVARSSIRPALPDIEPVVEQVFQERMRQLGSREVDRTFVRNQIREQVKAEFQIVRSGFVQRWTLNLGRARHRLADRPLYLRVKFTTADPNKSTIEEPKSYPTIWQAGVPETSKVWRQQLSLAADSFHEFALPPNLFDDNGQITVECLNPNNVDLLFLMEDGLELLYREGGFTLNYLRGLGIIFCWIALLAAVGLACASFLSFPVAAFASVAILIIGMSSGTLAQVIEEGGVTGVNPNTGRIDAPQIVDRIAMAAFGGLLKVVNLVRGFSPIDLLSSGRSIGWGQLARAAAQIVLLMGGLFAAFGIALFTRRELAAAQGDQG